MGKYKGDDGWLYDDTVEPNCEAPAAPDGEDAGQSPVSDSAAAGCLILAGLSSVTPLIGMGVGYGIWGFGGLLIGLGAGIAVPVVLMVAALGMVKKGNE